MSALLFRLGRNCARHPVRVIGTWLLFAVAAVALRGAAGGEFNDSFRVPGVESQRAADVLTQRFPSQAGRSARIVLHVDDGRLDDAAHRSAVNNARRQLSRSHAVATVTDPYAAQSAAISTDGRTAYLDVAYTVDKHTVTQLHDAKIVAEKARAACATVFASRSCETVSLSTVYATST